MALFFRFWNVREIHCDLTTVTAAKKILLAAPERGPLCLNAISVCNAWFESAENLHLPVDYTVDFLKQFGCNVLSWLRRQNEIVQVKQSVCFVVKQLQMADELRSCLQTALSFLSWNPYGIFWGFRELSANFCLVFVSGFCLCVCMCSSLLILCFLRSVLYQSHHKLWCK